MPMFISSPNRSKWLEKRVMACSMSVLDSKTNAPSSTYIMQNKSNIMLDKKLLGWWLTNCPVDLGDFFA